MLDTDRNITEEVAIQHFNSTLVVTLHLRPLRSTDCTGVEPMLTRAARRYAMAQTRNKH